MTIKNGVLAENKSLASIRGIAALWVVGHHWLAQSSTQWVQTIFGEGFRAVDIFFVLSGLILTLVYSELRLGAMPRFMAQRVFRLYPLHMAALLFLTTVIQIPNINGQEFLLPGFAASMLLLQPYIHFVAYINPPAWSIGVEMLFYILFPFFLLALKRMESSQHCKKTLALLLCLLLLAQNHQMLTNYGSHFGMDAFQRGIYSFVLGMVLAKFSKLVALSASMATIIECVTCMAICAAIAWHQSAYVPALAAILMFSLSYDVGALAVALRARVLVWLGHISFSVYLLHYALQVAMDKIGAFEALGAGDAAHKLLRLGVLLAVLLLVSTLAHRYVEMPCRRIPARFSAWRKSLTWSETQPATA